MIRPSALLMLCLTLLLPMAAVARLDGPLEVAKPGKVRDLVDIRSSRTLRVLVNQSRNSSGEIQGQAIGVEYHYEFFHVYSSFPEGMLRIFQPAGRVVPFFLPFCLYNRNLDKKSPGLF